MHDWFYRVEGTEEGPISEEDLKHIFDSRVLSLDTAVWRDGLADWIPAGEYQEFAKALRNKPRPHATEAANPNSKKILIGVGLCIVTGLVLIVAVFKHRVLFKSPTLNMPDAATAQADEGLPNPDNNLKQSKNSVVAHTLGDKDRVLQILNQRGYILTFQGTNGASLQRGEMMGEDSNNAEIIFEGAGVREIDAYADPFVFANTNLSIGEMLKIMDRNYGFVEDTLLCLGLGGKRKMDAILWFEKTHRKALANATDFAATNGFSLPQYSYKETATFEDVDITYIWDAWKLHLSMVPHGMAVALQTFEESHMSGGK